MSDAVDHALFAAVFGETELLPVRRVCNDALPLLPVRGEDVQDGEHAFALIVHALTQ